jgi:hypothetical protein
MLLGSKSSINLTFSLSTEVLEIGTVSISKPSVIDLNYRFCALCRDADRDQVSE